jgi:hypothetical protein
MVKEIRWCGPREKWGKKKMKKKIDQWNSFLILSVPLENNQQGCN